ncbi:MAG: acyl-CoA synthetase, partial [Solirubrobacteraceae bacterium]|nr:acyl-CoA synthetase [Solirubrobacteraceae bacterium]
MNFVTSLVDAAPPGRRALLELARDGSRREWSFGEVADHSARLAGTLAARGVRKGDVVLTLIGNRPDWVFAMLACWRLGAVALPGNEMLRAKDLRLRLETATPKLVIADERNRAELEAARPEVDVLLVPDESLYDAPPEPAAAVTPTDPAVVIFTSGTSGAPKAVVHGVRYLLGQHVQAEHWFGARE